MLIGHYATALIPYAYESNRRLAPFFVFLILTQILDFIMLALVLVGVESVEPSSFVEASFANMVVDMTYSHDILPVLIIAVVVALIVAALFKSTTMGLWALGLIVLHELMDLLVGFEHYWFGAGETVFGFGLYTSAPVMGILIEVAICVGLLVWYLKKRAASGNGLSRAATLILYGVLVGSTASLLLMANQSLGKLLGL